MADAVEHVFSDGGLEIWRVSVPFFNGPIEATNCHVVVSAGCALIVDAGAKSRRGLRVFRDALDNLGVRPQDADYFITHTHFDHIGLLSVLVGPRSNVYVGEKEWVSSCDDGALKKARWMRAELARQGVTEGDLASFERYLSPRMSPMVDPECLCLVQGGAEIVVGDESLRVVELPGHTNGHMGLVCDRAGIIFSGDHVLGKFSPSISVGPNWANPLGDYLDSLRSVLDERFEVMAWAHGRLDPYFEDRIHWLIEHHEERLDAIAGLVGAAGSSLTGFEIARAVEWNVPVDCWEDIAPLQRWCIVKETMAYLRLLVSSGMLLPREEEGRVIYYRP